MNNKQREWVWNRELPYQEKFLLLTLVEDRMHGFIGSTKPGLLAEAMGMSIKQVRNSMNALKKAGLVDEKGCPAILNEEFKQ